MPKVTRLYPTGRLPCLLRHILFPIFRTGPKSCTYVSSPGNKYANGIRLNVRNFIATAWPLVCVPFLFTCQQMGYLSGRNFSYFQITFRMKCTLDSYMPTALTKSRTVYLTSLSMISMALFLPDAVIGCPDFAALVKHVLCSQHLQCMALWNSGKLMNSAIG